MVVVDNIGWLRAKAAALESAFRKAAADMGWRVHSAFAVLAWQGKVSFNIRIYGAAQGVTLEVGWVSIAAIGGDAA